MNERIRQLYEQAHIERRQEYFSSVVDPTIKSVSVTRHFDLDLFAELIVEECLLCCERVISDPVPKSIDTFEQGGIHCMDEIKEHFGVEE